jgi:hypothetical protein
MEKLTEDELFIIIATIILCFIFGPLGYIWPWWGRRVLMAIANS